MRETLFFNCRKRLPVFNEASRRIMVNRVDSKRVHPRSFRKDQYMLKLNFH
jgi:hypothetical protein